MATNEYLRPCKCCSGRGHVLDGKAARKLRTKAGKTQGEVAKYMGVSTVYVSDLERGQRRFRGQTTERYLGAVGVSLSTNGAKE